jgi:hypothetical protein
MGSCRDTPRPPLLITYHDGQAIQTHVSHGFGLEGGGAGGAGARNTCGVDVGGWVWVG